MASEEGAPQGHRPHRCLPTSTSTMSSTDGPDSGDVGTHMATWSSCGSLTTLFAGSNTKVMRSSSSPTFVSGSRSLGSNCTPKRHGSSSLGGMPPEGDRHVGSASRRRSSFSLHACLREDEGRAVLAQAHHDLEADAGEATRGQRPAQGSPAPAHPRTGQMARKRGARAPCLLCRAATSMRSRPPHPGDEAMVKGAAASEPEDESHLGTDGPPRKSVAAARPCVASLSRTALRRSDLRQEPSAVVRTLGSARGAARKGGPYRNFPKACSRPPTWEFTPADQIVLATRGALGPARRGARRPVAGRRRRRDEVELDPR